MRVCQRSGHFSNDLSQWSAKVLGEVSDQPRKNGSRWIYMAQFGSWLHWRWKMWKYQCMKNNSWYRVKKVEKAAKEGPPARHSSTISLPWLMRVTSLAAARWMVLCTERIIMHSPSPTNRLLTKMKGNTGKYRPRWAGPIRDISLLGWLYWVYIIPYGPFEDFGMAALRIHQGVRQ